MARLHWPLYSSAPTPGPGLQREAPDKHAFPQLGAPTMALQQLCTSSAAQGSAQVPPQAVFYSQEHSPQQEDAASATKCS